MKYEKFALRIANHLARKKGIRGLDKEGLQNTALFICWLELQKFEPEKCKGGFEAFAVKRVRGAVLDEISFLSDDRREGRRSRRRQTRSDVEGDRKRGWPLPARVTSMSGFDKIHDKSKSGIDLVAENEEVGLLLSFIHNETNRMICTMRFVGGYRNVEIAKICNLSQDHVSQRIFQGITAIRTMFPGRQSRCRCNRNHKLARS